MAIRGGPAVCADPASMVSLLALAAGGVVWLVWQDRIARAVPPHTLRRSPGMHIASWIIPVVTWWFPFQNLVDLRRATRPDAPAAQAALWGGWWALWIGSSILGYAGTFLLQRAEDLAAVGTAAGVTAFAAVVDLALAGAAILVVRSLTRSALATLPR